MNSQPLRPPSAPSQDLPAPPPQPTDSPVPPSPGWSSEPFETREVRKARERADRAARRADRAAWRLDEAQGRAAGQRSGARQLVDAAGDAATAALTAVSAAADEAQARLAAKARMRELEHAVVTARAGGRVDVSPPTRDEALKLVDRVDPGSSEASFARGVGFMLAGIAALAMMTIGGFGWLGVVVPLAIVIAGGSLGGPTPNGGPEPQGRSDPARARTRQPRFDRRCAASPRRRCSGGDDGRHRTAEAYRKRRPADPR